MDEVVLDESGYLGNASLTVNNDLMLDLVEDPGELQLVFHEFPEDELDFIIELSDRQLSQIVVLVGPEGVSIVWNNAIQKPIECDFLTKVIIGHILPDLSVAELYVLTLQEPTEVAFGDFLFLSGKTE